MAKSTGNSSRRTRKKAKRAKKREAPSPELGHEQRFDQLLDDTIFEIKKKDQRG